MGFPSREFGAQEYKSDEEIAEFARSMKFPGVMMKLGSVKGSSAPEVWQFLKKESGAKDPTWNFRGKFLVSKSGVVTSTSPGSVEDDIAALMKE